MKQFSTVIQLLFACFCAVGLLLALGSISPVQAQPDLVALRGKALGKPVYELIGGKTKETLRAYATGVYAEPPTELRAFLFV